MTELSTLETSEGGGGLSGDELSPSDQTYQLLEPLWSLVFVLV